MKHYVSRIHYAWWKVEIYRGVKNSLFICVGRHSFVFGDNTIG